ncbi:MAG: hypothetical protein OM95_16205 [Bdellovibrio sp. ArHS]|uniref:hypothetical protein n=1 Tax=Bdellovibrio sp. ArHS TaxID=1569284 RepID=UPI0005838E3B|nr:hypothetical protein [Bdellovibrio sp. ArHS]KHD87122.1 MAG: hypothetical protein OM95_16205 [Bdellovibrio sp. ArHS]
MKIFSQRRRLIVNREIQYDVLMYVGIFVMSIFVVQALALYLFLSRLEPVVSHMTALEFVTKYKVSFLIYQLIPVGFGMVVGVYVFNRLTSRIVGPLYNVKRVLQNAVENQQNPDEIKLRENDYFREEINDLNVILKRKMK